MLQYLHSMWSNLFAIHSPLVWLAFLAFVGGVLAFDLGVLNKKDHVPTMKQAALYSLFYIALSCGVGVLTWFTMGSASGMQFFSGYLIEKSMSVDNLMMFIAIFAYFQVPKEYHHRVLFWGVLGAIVMRFVAITLGVVVVSAFHPFLLIFAALLLFAAYKIFFMDDEDEEYEENAIVKWVAAHFRMTDKLDGHKFTTKVNKNGKWLRYATPLLLVIVAIETTDLMFATDSIPAIFAVSKDLFILFASNICAILGLRALFFVVESVLDKLCYLKKALGVVLAFVGFKMVLESLHSIFVYFHWTALSSWTSLEISTGASLIVIGGIIGLASAASLLFPAKKEEAEQSPEAAKALKDPSK
ncbi:MAG TPA: TerC/Alx family metal homeostasis membrane protein [Planktothrix sp.]|jgi:tellurite resistance protein TerC